jgi:hypothetical protein
MLQTLILDVADAESRCCRHVLSVANIFSMLQTLRFDVGYCTQHGSQHGRNKVSRNMVATWGRKERLLMLGVASNRVRNIFATCSQHTRNI